MRDYIVLYRSFTGQHSNWEWIPEAGGHSQVTTQHGDIGATKTYERIPNQALLLDFFNQENNDPLTYYISINNIHYGFGEAWGRLFGANIVGGYDSLENVPTSDAFGALN